MSCKLSAASSRLMSKPVAASLVILFALGGCGGGSGGDETRQLASAWGPPPNIPASWLASSWFIDPANATGAAADSNACTTETAPCLTFAAVAHQWGTYSPRLRQNTTLTFLSSHSDNSDPLYLSPLLEDGAALAVQGVLGSKQQLAAGTLSNVVSKNRASGQLLQATLPAGAAVGQLVANTTKSSRAWVYKSAGGNGWFLSQPLASQAADSYHPDEDDTWADGDSIVLYQPVAVNIAEASPNLTDSGPSFQLVFEQLTILSPSGSGLDDLMLGSDSDAFFLETAVQRRIVMGVGPAQTLPFFINADISGSVQAGLASPGAYLSFIGGQVRSPMLLRGGDPDGDLILGGDCRLIDGSFGTAFVDAGATLSLVEGTAGINAAAVAPTQYGGPFLWGPGALDVGGGARLEYPAGQGKAQATFLQSGRITLNGEATACAVDTAGSGGWKCGIALTASNLDTPISSGGFGGTAVNPGGGAISNAGTDQ
jgi:hypothetical protein